MKMQKPVTALSSIIAVLAIVAAATGVITSWAWPAWFGGGSRVDFTTLHGETVQLWGSGLYRLDSVSGASQEIAQDVITLLLGVPLLIVAIVLAYRGSLRGKVLLTGTLGYLLYTYAALTMLSTYNELFLVYVALMSLCFFAFVVSLTGIDVAGLPARFSGNFPRRGVAIFSIILGAMLGLLWLKLIVPSLLAGTPPAGIDNYSTLVIQAMDLAFIVPTAILTGVLLLRKSALGYLLSSVVLVIGLTMGAALLAMIAGQAMAGVAVDPVGSVLFILLVSADAVLFVRMMRSLIGSVSLPADGTSGLQVVTRFGEATGKS